MINAALNSLTKIASDFSEIVEATERFPTQLLSVFERKAVKFELIEQMETNDSTTVTLELAEAGTIPFITVFGRRFPFDKVTVPNSVLKSFKAELKRLLKNSAQAQLLLRGVVTSQKIYQTLQHTEADANTRLDLIEVGSNKILTERMTISDIISVINKKQLAEPKLTLKNDGQQLLATLNDLRIKENGALENHSYIGFYVREHGDKSALLPKSHIEFSHNKVHALLKKSNKNTTYDVYQGVRDKIGENLLEGEIFELPQIKALGISEDKVQHQFRYLKDTALFGKPLASRRYYSRYYKHKGFFLAFHGDTEAVTERPNAYTQHGYGALLFPSSQSPELIYDIDALAGDSATLRKELNKTAQDNARKLALGEEPTKLQCGVIIELGQISLDELKEYGERNETPLNTELVDEIQRLNTYCLFVLEQSF